MKTASRASGADRAQRAAMHSFYDQAMRLHLEVVETVLPTKVEHTFRQWFSRVESPDENEPNLQTLAVVMSLAMVLEAATPSHSGATAYDRLARRRTLAPDEQKALAALKASRFTPFRIRAEGSDDRHDAEDLGTGQGFTLFEETLLETLVGPVLFAQLFPMPDGTFATTGQEVVLDEAALAVALDFVRPSRGIPHSHRCAAAVYRHLVRHGGLLIPALTAADAAMDEEESVVSAELDRLAVAVTAGTGDGPSPDILAEVRRLTSADAILEALFKSVTAGRLDHPRAGAIHRRFAEAMMEALQLRALAGSGFDRSPLDRMAEIVADQCATNDYPAAAETLFRDIRAGLSAQKPRAAGDDVARVIERIRALRAKTIDQGCTEAEVLAAADKVAELLDRYGLSLSETELRGQSCIGVGIESRRKRSGPLEAIVPAIAHFCGCRAWHERTADDAIRSVFFGLPGDVEAAQYLYERVETALETELAAFRKGDIYGSLAGGGRQKATSSFQLGLVRGIGEKLTARKAERDAKTFATTGRDLVPVKAAVVDEELDKLGLAFTQKSIAGSRMLLRDAFEAGQVASGRFEIQSALE